MEKGDDIPIKIEVGVYWHIDEETGKFVFDTDEMTEEFESKMKEIVEGEYK